MTMGTHVGVHSCECVRLLQLGGGANGLLKSVKSSGQSSKIYVKSLKQS